MITKSQKSLPYPLSIIIQLSVINLAFLKQRFDDYIFQISVLHVQLFIYLFYQSFYI